MMMMINILLCVCIRFISFQDSTHNNKLNNNSKFIDEHYGNHNLLF